VRKRHPTIQEAQQAAIDEGEQYWERPDVLLQWDVRLMHRMKHWAKVVAAVVGFGTAAGTAVSGVVKAVRWVRAGGSTPPAELPATGQPTIATDHVEKPKAP